MYTNIIYSFFPVWWCACNFACWLDRDTYPGRWWHCPGGVPDRYRAWEERVFEYHGPCPITFIFPTINWSRAYESVLVPHSSLKCNSKFLVWTRNFQLGCRNFQFAEVEISSLNSKFPVGMSKFPVCRSRNFEFELEISSWDVEISSLPKSKFPVWNSKFPLWTRNFQFDEVEISSCWLVI